MSENKGINTLKALADESRFMIVYALLEKPHYVEELAARLGLADSTVSFHLKKLEKAGLVFREKQQYYVVFYPDVETFDLTLRELIKAEPVTIQQQEERIDEYKQKVLNTFFKDGRLVTLPAQHKKRKIILEIIAQSFDPDSDIPEREVNELISVIYDDYCTIRRLLVDEGFMSREHSTYRLVKKPGMTPDQIDQKVKKEVIIDRKKELTKAYKQSSPLMGIFQIKNLQNGKIFVGSSQNIPGIINRYRFELKLGNHKNRHLQAEWNEYGSNGFSFETLETIEPKTDPGWKPADELNKLKDLWLEKLQPFGKRGYNSKPFK